jgi:2-hydroxy-6-oxonona-2,4-dienedioate hydrolase
MASLNVETRTLGSRRTRLLRGGKAGGPAALFLHGGSPGATPFCSGSHIWGDSLLPFAEELDLIAPDCPGSGGTDLGEEPLTVEAIGSFALALLADCGITSVDVIGHEIGGLVGIWLALSRPQTVRSLSIIASPMCAPVGDALDDIVLVAPPRPLWSRESQTWALERLSYSHMHIDRTLLDACVAASDGEPHRQAAIMAKTSSAKAFGASMSRTRSLLWETCRNAGVQVPVQIVWASHDPVTTREAGFVLFDTIAAKQRASQFHVINRAGSLVFREQPSAFHHVVASFGRGVRDEKAHAA